MSCKRSALVEMHIFRQEVLLADLPVEVAARKTVPLADEGQRLLGVQRGDPCGQVHAGVGVSGGVVQA